MKRITTRLKKESVTTMANWPEEKCTEMPGRLEGMVSIKRRKRRVINIARKFYAVLDKGILKLFSKKRAQIAPNPEFQIDLAKTTVMYDEKRIILIFKTANESHTLTPLEHTLDHWKDAICKHRLYRQEAVGFVNVPTYFFKEQRKGLQPDSNQTLEALSTRQKFDDEKGWDPQSGNKMFDEVHQMQGLTLEVLEKLTKTYEEMQRTSEEMKQTLKNIRDAMARPSGTETTSMWTTGTYSVTPSNASSFGRSVQSTTPEMSTTSEMPTDSKAPEASGSDDDDDDGRRQSASKDQRKKKK